MLNESAKVSANTPVSGRHLYCDTPSNTNLHPCKHTNTKTQIQTQTKIQTQTQIQISVRVLRQKLLYVYVRIHRRTVVHAHTATMYKKKGLIQF